MNSAPNGQYALKRVKKYAGVKPISMGFDWLDHEFIHGTASSASMTSYLIFFILDTDEHGKTRIFLRKL